MVGRTVVRAVVYNIFLLLIFVPMFFLESAPNNAGISVELVSPNGDLIDQAGVGQPFILHVVVRDANENTRVIDFGESESLRPQYVGTRMHSINGKSTGRYLYKFCINSPGRYTVGPITVKHNNQEIIVDGIDVVVADGHFKTAKKNNQKDNDVLLYVSANQDRVVVGQKIVITLRCCYRENARIHRIMQPEIKDCAIREASGPLSGHQTIDGQHYDYAEWTWECYPSAPGVLAIPAYQADCDIIKRGRNTMGALTSFFSLSFLPDTKRVYSKALSITVDPLPPYDKPISAVGLFRKLTATVNPSVIKKGEGMVFALEVEGEGNLHDITFLSLSNIPDNLQWYSSKSEILKPNETEGTRKRFEFIIQASEVGEFEIPGQEFTYFDTEKNECVTLESSPVLISVIPNLVSAVQNKQIDMKDSYDDIFSEPRERLFQSCQGPWRQKQERSPISWNLFFVMCIAPIVVSLLGIMRNRWRMHVMRSKKGIKKELFCKARSLLYSAQKKGATEEIYTIFFCVLQNHFSASQTECTEENISYVFEQTMMTTDEKREWHLFFSRVAEIAFDRDTKKRDEEALLFQQASEWLDCLERIL